MAEIPNVFPHAGSLPYGFSLADTHLVHGALAATRREVQADVEGLPAELTAGFTSWHMPGRFGEIPRTAAEIYRPLATYERKDALRRGAELMVAVGVLDVAAGEHFPGRTPNGAEYFFGSAREAFVHGTVPKEDQGGPRHQSAIFQYLGKVGEKIIPDDTRRRQVGAVLGEWSYEWLAQLGVSNGEHDPERLRASAELLGQKCMKMGAVMLTGTPGNKAALGALGAMGGLEQHGNDPFAAVKRGIHTYTTALVAQHGGKKGLEMAYEMRTAAEAVYYKTGVQGLDRRQTGVYDTVTWFIRAAGWKERRDNGLTGRSAKRTAKHLESAVKGALSR